MDIGSRLKHLRIASGCTQREISQSLRITYRSYQRYESGEHNPSIDKLIELARFFNVSLDYLVGESDNPTRK